MSVRWQRVSLWTSLGFLVLLTLGCFLGPALLDDQAGEQALSQRLKPPFWMEGSLPGSPLGTDAFGRDMLSRTLEGGRVSLEVGLLAATGAVIIGTALGVISGFWGGWFDRMVTAFADIWLAFPFMVLALAAVAVVGSDLPVLIGLLILGGWVLPTRVARTIAQRARSEDYVVAAAGAGACPGYLMRRHVLPQVIPVVLVVWSFSIGALVVIEGALSFLGLGVRPPTPSWGNIMSDGTVYLETAWWIAAWPSLMIVLTVVCANGLGNGLRRLWHVDTGAVPAAGEGREPEPAPDDRSERAEVSA